MEIVVYDADGLYWKTLSMNREELKTFKTKYPQLTFKEVI